MATFIAGSSTIYQNPLVNQILKILYEDDRVIIHIFESTWQLWYPVAQDIDLIKLNLRLRR